MTSRARLPGSCPSSTLPSDRDLELFNLGDPVSSPQSEATTIVITWSCREQCGAGGGGARHCNTQGIPHASKCSTAELFPASGEGFMWNTELRHTG